MLELLWVADEVDARSTQTAPTRLRERWVGWASSSAVCPFGVVVRGCEDDEAPFPAWAYRPDWLPSELRIYVGVTEAGVEEPMWVFMPMSKRLGSSVVGHLNGVGSVTRVVLVSPRPIRSRAAQVLTDAGVLVVEYGPEWLLRIQFDGGLREESRDFRPGLPIVVER